MKPYKLFWLMKGKVLHIGDTITANDCGTDKIEEGYDFERLDKFFKIDKFVKDLNDNITCRGEHKINNVIYITNQSNKIVGIIPINYKETEVSK